MDAVFRLRVVIWLLVLSLWGVMVYQFLGEEELQTAQMQPLANPYKGVTAPQAPPASGVQPLPARAFEEAAKLLAPGALPEPPAARLPGGSSLDYIKPLPALPPRTVRPPRPARPFRREQAARETDLPMPPGFFKTITRHFTVFTEGDPPSETFLNVLESLHGNLMLDLASFSPWANDERVALFLFKSQETYRQVTGRPAWSGGASSVPKRKVYVYESEELPGILAHELCHIYYDGFFLDGRANPLWLSEGMATLVQVERGLAAPSWLRENLEILERGGGYSIEELMTVATTAGASDDRVRLWYAQSYSLVRFLIRNQYKSSFYKFSAHLRDGKDPTQSLYRAYGMPFNRLKALEYAWRYELANASMTRMAPNSPR